MILAFLLALPLCVEVAGWLVDATFVTGVLNEHRMSLDEEQDDAQTDSTGVHKVQKQQT